MSGTSEVKADGKIHLRRVQEQRQHDKMLFLRRRPRQDGDSQQPGRACLQRYQILLKGRREPVQNPLGLHWIYPLSTARTDSSQVFQMSVNNKNVIITGAAGGIGRAAALAFAKDGFGVLINYRTSEDAALALCREINEENGRAVCFRADVSAKRSGRDDGLRPQGARQNRRSYKQRRNRSAEDVLRHHRAGFRPHDGRHG